MAKQPGRAADDQPGTPGCEGEAPRSGQSASWALDLICCGRDEGSQGCETGEQADQFRLSYCDAEGHDRRAIKRRAVEGEPLGWHPKPENVPPPPSYGYDRAPFCALCDGDGDVVNPGNADPTRAIEDWLPPIGCPRCGGTGKDPNYQKGPHHA